MIMSMAQRLWHSEIHEARIMASLVDAAKLVTEAQMETWVRDFDSWDVCDLCCMNLFRKTRFAYRKAIEWSAREEEFVKRAGFALMATLAVHDKRENDSVFQEFLPIIEKEASDERNFVKKAVNWALRQIGKRNRALNKLAIESAERIQMNEFKAGAMDSAGCPERTEKRKDTGRLSPDTSFERNVGLS